MKINSTAIAIAACLAAFGAGLGVRSAAQSHTPPAQTTQAPQNGPFQIVFSPHNRTDTFMIDTQDGLVWGFAANKDGTEDIVPILVDPNGSIVLPTDLLGK